MTDFEQNSWFIYRGSETLGPFSASELRAALRLGELDPFDKVGKASSSLRQNLIDIDEIFNTDSADTTNAHDPALRAVPERAHEPVRQTKRQEARREKRDLEQSRASSAEFENHSIQVSSMSGHGTSVSQGYFGGAAVHRDTPSSKPPEDFRQNMKPFYVTHKGKFWGPFHAPEIIAEFKRGNISKRSYVIRNGYKARLHIQKFVAQYKQRLAAKGPQRSLIHPMASGKSIFVLKSPDSSQWLAIAFVALCALIMSILAYDFFLKAKPNVQQPRTGRSGQIQNVPPIRSVEKPAVRTPFKPQIVQQRQTLSPALSRPIITPPVVRPQKAAASLQIATPKKVKAAVKKAPSKKIKKIPAKKVVKRTIPRTTLGSVAGLRSKVGSQVSIGPLRYDTNAVKKCSGKCTISFKGRNGTVKGIFFKAAYGRTLLKQGGTTGIKGRVMVGGKSLLIQGIN